MNALLRLITDVCTYHLLFYLSQDEVLDFQSWLSDTKKQLMSRDEADEGSLEDKINENQVSTQSIESALFIYIFFGEININNTQDKSPSRSVSKYTKILDRKICPLISSIHQLSDGIKHIMYPKNGECNHYYR